MQRRSSSVNVSLEEGSHRDVGVLELVADPQTGKRGIRRVFPATMNGVQPDPDTNSTVHLNGDGGGTESARRRPSLAILTQTHPEPEAPLQASPLPRQETTSTLQSATPKPPQRLNVMRALRDSFTKKHDPNDRAHDRPLDLGSPLASGLPYANGSIQALGNAWKGKEKEVAGLFQDSEGDKLSVVMDDARKNRLATKAREIREWMKGRSMHRGANTNTTVNANAHVNANDNHNGRTYGKIIQNNSFRRKPGPNNTGSGMRDLFKGRRQNTANSATAGPTVLSPSGPGPTPTAASPATAPPRLNQGPKPGQTYEIYEQRIIETNPERTVELSTWREQVPLKKNSSDQQDKISIYYITADEYAEEDRPMAKVEWRVDGGDTSTPDSPVTSVSPNLLGASIHGRPHRPSHSRHGSSYHSTRPSDPRNRHSYHAHVPETPTVKKDKAAHNGHRPNGKRLHLDTRSVASPSASRVASPITPPRTKDGTISPSSSERDLSITPTVTDKTPVPVQHQHSGGSKFAQNMISAPSSPVGRSGSQAGTRQRGLRHAGRRELPPNESTPVATVSQGHPASANGTGSPGLAPPTPAGAGRSMSAPPSSSPPALTVVTAPPFNPTRDTGSTISSIRSVASAKFEAVLQSCEPSLLHIAPALRQLGIRHLEHLRAVGKLTPATRDREVKEGALKLGITVVEWAILLDRIFIL